MLCMPHILIFLPVFFLHRPILMKTILYSATTKTPINVYKLAHAYLLFTPHFPGIIEISARVHSFQNGGIPDLVDPSISSSFLRSVDLKIFFN